MSQAIQLADESAIADYVEGMERIRQQIWWLHDYAAREVANEAGFRGLFAALRPALDELTSGSRAVAEHFSSAYGAVISAVEEATASLRACDSAVNAELSGLARRVESAR
ncbi:MAG: hypothetical protein ACRCYU_05950 [Nocardioides sp.]